MNPNVPQFEEYWREQIAWEVRQSAVADRVTLDVISDLIRHPDEG